MSETHTVYSGSIIRREIPIFTFQREAKDDVLDEDGVAEDNQPKLYVPLAIRHPKKTPHELCWGQVRAARPRMGVYLDSILDDQSKIPYVAFIDYFFERPPTPRELRLTHVTKVRFVCDDWNRQWQCVALIDGGVVFAIVDVYLDAERALITEYAHYPVSLRGAYEPFSESDR